MQQRQRDLTEFDFRTMPAAEIAGRDREMIFDLFDVAYRDANHAYLERSLGKLRYIALATHGGAPAGFSLGDMRLLDLPRLPQQPVAMAGICCIAPEFRRRGLFGELERRAMAGAGIMQGGRFLSCGRMAHPVSFRTMSANPTAIPRPGVPITPWQQEIGIAIAQAYGAPGFDPRTFVCKGDGKPIGYPVLELDVTPEEWIVFKDVDRDKGDSLLGMVWHADAPEGWLTT